MLPAIGCDALHRCKILGSVASCLANAAIAQRGRAYADQGESVRPVMPVARDQTDPRRVAADHEPKAVMLDFVDPARTARRALSSGWQTGLNERGHTHCLRFRSPANVVNYSRAGTPPRRPGGWRSSGVPAPQAFCQRGL